MTCSWLITCSLLVLYLFMTYLWIVHYFSWLIHGLFTTCSQVPTQFPSLPASVCKLWCRKWMSWHEGHFLQFAGHFSFFTLMFWMMPWLGVKQNRMICPDTDLLKTFHPFPSYFKFWFCLLHRQMGENKRNWGCVSSGRVRSSSLKCYSSLGHTGSVALLESFKALKLTLY